MPEIFNIIIGFVLAIGILVVIHEWGHYIAAKLTGMRADVFSFGMGRRLFGWNKKTGFTLGPLPNTYEFDGTTDWRFSLLPIGGYVKIPGMVDESFDNEFADAEPKPWEFRSKNTFQKAFVLANGVIMNILLSIFVFAGIYFFNGESSIATTRFAHVSETGIASDLGFMAGDSLISINDEKVESWDELIFELALNNVGEDTKVDLIRNNKLISFNINNEPILSELSDHDNREQSPTSILGFDLPYQKLYTTSVLSLSPAQNLGLKKGDTLLAINNVAINSSLQLLDLIKNNSDNIPLTLRWKRGDNIHNGIAYTNDNKLGFGYGYKYEGPIKKKEFTALESIELGFDKTVSFFGIIFKSIGKMVKGVVKFEDAMAGPVTIANQAGKTLSYSFMMFIDLVAKLSISLALINILPIPALDGGHLLIVLIEGLRRKELNTKTKIVIQNFGVLFLFIFMLIILYIDILRI